MKTKNHTTAIVLILLLNLFLILPSCGDPEIEYFIDDETKSYCYFENGASYIYKDSVTGIIDSLKISKNWYFTRDHQESTEVIESAYIYWNDDDIGDISNNWNAKKKGDISIMVTVDGVCSAYYSIYSNFSTYYYSESVNNTELISIISNMQIGDNIYYNVKKFYSINNNSEYYYSYWAKNVGLIRYEAYDINNSLLKNINLIEYEIYN